MLYELYVEGKIGLHKGKPTLRAIYSSAVTADREMLKILSRGECAFVVKKKLSKTI